MVDILKGNLKDYRLSDILTGLQKDTATGTLQIADAAYIRKVFFKNGNIIFAASDDREEQPGELLLKEGRISFEEYNHLSDTVSKTGQDIKNALVKYGYVTPDELFHLLKRQAEEIILGLFAVEEGVFEFHSALPPDLTERDFHLNAADMVYKGIIRINSFTHLQRWCPPMDTVLSLSGDPRSIFREVVPDDTDKKILSYVNGLYSLKMVLMFSPVNDFETLKRVCAFLGTGIIRIKGREETEVPGTLPVPEKGRGLSIEQAVPEKEEGTAAPDRGEQLDTETPGQAKAEMTTESAGTAEQSAEAAPEASEREAVTPDIAVVSADKREGRKWIWVSITAISIILTLLALAYVLYENIRKRSPEPVHTEERIPLPPFREKLFK